MSYESNAGFSARPGWYPDPEGSGQVRWWDGTAWTAHLANPGGTTTASTVQPGTPVYNPFIWLVAVVLPILSLLVFVSFDFTGYLTRSMEASLDPSATTQLATLLDPGYLLVTATSWVIYGLTVIFAYLDWRRLRRDGYVRPFHWAWAFLNSLVYTIGRSVVAHRRSSRGYLPLWLAVVVLVVTLVVVFIQIGQGFAAVFELTQDYVTSTV
ncbi:DUF2510 domain-containing protein [Compostimonas suwonensis]|uniref:Uncharacterized protein DUF2510 n=1 Tax=Compostimonas suwonensis TaxID=1048394 RepID=A0A2M9BBD9_9MICO|nr:DUF2510 domain-containing protein [Compostimonas suwonensis]PJJ55271.1 uncharacterized protein DUF2510 [Compostimonas suwonensis]